MILTFVIIGLICSIFSTLFVLSAAMLSSQASQIVEDDATRRARALQGRAATLSPVNKGPGAHRNLRPLTAPIHRFGAREPQ